MTLENEAGRILPAIEAVPALQRSTVKGRLLQVYADRAGEAIPAILRITEQAGLVPADIRLTPPSLETLFVSLTGRKLD